MGEQFGSQATAALVIVFVIDWLKKVRAIPWVTYNTEKTNHWLALLMSGAATLGITFTFSAEQHQLLIGGLNWHTIIPGLGHWLQTFAMSKGAYHLLAPSINPPSAKPVMPITVTQEADKT